MYCLLSSQVFSGDGRSGATLVLSIAQITSVTPMPRNGRNKVARSIRLVIRRPLNDVVDVEFFHVLFRLGRIEFDAVKKRFLLHVLLGHGDGHLLGDFAGKFVLRAKKVM